MKPEIIKEFHDRSIHERFKTAGSKSFDLISNKSSLGKGASIGWIEIHYPCEGHIKLRAKASLPESLQNKPEKLRELSALILELAGADPLETFELEVFTTSHRVGVDQRVAKNGMTDSI